MTDLYSAGKNNCVHFADELCEFLLNGQGIPREYLVTLDHPFVKTFLGLS